jgi:nitrous oxidase accessory protein
MKALITFCLLVIGFQSFPNQWKVKTSAELERSLRLSAAKDTIVVLKGHYKVLNLEITKPLVIIGENLPILDAQFKGEIFIVKSDNVSISGFRFKNVGETSMIDWAGIKVLEAKHIKITNNEFSNCYFGVYLSSSNHCLVEKNKIIGQPKEEQTTGNGIHAWKCDSIEIKNNYIEGHRDGIYFEFVTNSLINNNLSTKNIRYGLHFMFSHYDTYTGNIFSRNGAGVAVMYTKHVAMKGNFFDSNWGSSAFGILLKDISDSEIEHNLFHSNTVGVYMEGCSRITMKLNRFDQNGVALRIQANCDENHINNNNFLSNTFDIATNGSVTFNYLNDNYWDKYEGYDLNRDGRGDILYRPVSLFSTLIERMPQAMILLRSFTASLLDKIEKIIPSLTPENLKDDSPSMKPVNMEKFNFKA